MAKRFTISMSNNLELKEPLDIYEVNLLDCRRHSWTRRSRLWDCALSMQFIYSATGINLNFSTSNIPLSVIFSEGITGSASNYKVKNGLKSISGEIMSIAS